MITDPTPPRTASIARFIRVGLFALAAMAAMPAMTAIAAMAQQPSTTTGTSGQTKAAKERAKAGSAAAPAAPKSAAPQSGTPARPRAAAPSGSAGAAGAPGGRSPAAAPGSPGAPAIGSPTPDMGNIDQILEGDEEVLAGGSAFTYDPGNRRDPFKSLLIAPDRPEFRGPRPEGVPGLLIDEIDLKGIFRTARGYVAQVNASNQKKSYLLKEGDQLYDGDVMSIGKNEVVFKQIVQDPTALKPFREIVKSLNPGG